MRKNVIIMYLSYPKGVHIKSKAIREQILELVRENHSSTRDSKGHVAAKIARHLGLDQRNSIMVKEIQSEIASLSTSGLVSISYKQGGKGHITELKPTRKLLRDRDTREATSSSPLAKTSAEAPIDWTPDDAVIRDLVTLFLHRHDGGVTEDSGRAPEFIFTELGLAKSRCNIKQFVGTLVLMEELGLLICDAPPNKRHTCEIVMVTHPLPAEQVQQLEGMEAELRGRLDPPKIVLEVQPQREPMVKPEPPATTPPSKRPPTLSRKEAYRVLILLALYDQEGSVTDRRGRAHQRILELLRLDNTPTVAFEEALKDLQREKLIKQEANAKGCREVAFAYSGVSLPDANMLETMRASALAIVQTFDAEDPPATMAALPPSRSQARATTSPTMPVLRRAFRTIVLLDLRRRGRIDNTDGYAARELLKRAGFYDPETPTALTMALGDLHHKEGLIGRDVTHGRCYAIWPIKDALSSRELAALEADEPTAVNILEGTDLQRTAGYVTTPAENEPEPEASLQPAKIESEPAPDPEPKPARTPEVPATPSVVRALIETPDQYTLVVAKQPDAAHDPGLYGRLLAAIRLLTDDRRRLQKQIQTQEAALAEATAATTSLENRLEELESENTELKTRVQSLGQELQAARDPSIAAAEKIAKLFDQRGLEGFDELP